MFLAFDLRQNISLHSQLLQLGPPKKVFGEKTNGPSLVLSTVLSDPVRVPFSLSQESMLILYIVALLMLPHLTFGHLFFLFNFKVSIMVEGCELGK